MCHSRASWHSIGRYSGRHARDFSGAGSTPISVAPSVRRDGRLAGYGAIRRCKDGYKVGPLFAIDEASADLLFRALAATASGETPLAIDVPAPNAAGVTLARRYGLEPVFETMRMYRGEDPQLPLSRIYGITTLEQG